MNSESGQILTQEEMEKRNKLFQEMCVQIDAEKMTTKQLKEMWVSKFDNRSILGKLRIKSRGSLRNKPCPCGSGLKFKKCCWNKTT